jgi:hypothetical protein
MKKWHKMHLNKRGRERGEYWLSSSGVDKWRRPVGLPLNFPLPISFFFKTNKKCCSFIEFDELLSYCHCIQLYIEQHDFGQPRT